MNFFMEPKDKFNFKKWSQLKNDWQQDLSIDFKTGKVQPSLPLLHQSPEFRVSVL